jgi:lysozyme
MAGKNWTIGQCLAFLNNDLVEAYADVDRCVTTTLTPQQAAAFSSFAFNVGGKKFCDSTLVKKANAGDMASSCAELSKWVYAGGKPLDGLVKRRAAERKLCETKEAV